MKIKALLFVLLGFMLATPAMAEFYVSGGVGVVKNTGDIHKGLSKEDYHNSPIYSLAFGYDLPIVNAFRAEGEILHNRAKISGGKGYVDLNALMANAYLDITLFPGILTPYVGVGLGYGRLESTHVLPMQLMLGVDVADISPLPITASAEYRFLKTNTEAKKATERDNYYGHVLMLKLRYEI